MTPTDPHAEMRRLLEARATHNRGPLLEDLVRCGLCGSPCKKSTYDRWTCSNAAPKGTCENNRGTQNKRLSIAVFKLAGDALTAPAMIARLVEPRLEAARQVVSARLAQRNRIAARLTHARERLDAETQRPSDAPIDTQTFYAKDVASYEAQLAQFPELPPPDSAAYSGLITKALADPARFTHDQSMLAEESIDLIREIIGPVILTPYDAPRGLAISLTNHPRATA